MRKIREALRLCWDLGRNPRQAGQSISAAPSTVYEYLKRAKGAGLSWPLPEDISDEELERKLFPLAEDRSQLMRPEPDWAWVHQELKRKKHVTRGLLWEEYKEQNPTGYEYSRFCYRYRKWRKGLDVTMRQHHVAGEKMFVDYAGDTVQVHDRVSQKQRSAQIFVAVLGASNYFYAEATWSQCIEDWIGSHVRALNFFGGVPRAIVPDNLKSGVTKACFYDPDINITYAKLARHYSTCILPARKRKAKDKAKVEKAVQIAEYQILARFRNRTFLGLDDLNRAIGQQVAICNARPFKKLPGTRRSLFESLERDALHALPEEPFEFAEWKTVRVNVDYHVEVHKHHYSVPYVHRRKEVEVRVTARIVEIFLNNKRIASHQRCFSPGQFTTQPKHMPPRHRSYLEWNPETFLKWADQIGAKTKEVINQNLSKRIHLEQTFRTCLGILRLEKQYTSERLEAACRRALRYNALGYKNIANILKSNLDQRNDDEQERTIPLITHDNIRGPGYYKTTGGVVEPFRKAN